MELSITLSRTLLGLPDLEINDHENYYVSELGDQSVTWRRQQASSPWVDGTVTTQRTKENVTRSISVEVLGSLWPYTIENAKALIDAVSQDSFILTIHFAPMVTPVEDAVSYLCEASDYNWVQTKERWHAQRGILNINLIHKPNPLTGDV